ncbi:HNH endonuclease [uncultured Martelella sp.]|uniref:HNH endonuclease n=1 Tax=uncultured Martelella sp. TaxID=392331 RepID=UPI0029C73073|nr:HNH endonuclease [uncultured Martelella sp.]
MKGRGISYSEAELTWIEAHAKDPRAAMHAAFCAHFGRDDVTLINLNALCKRRGWMTGRTGCFTPGQTPHNKGKPWPPGKGGRHPNARKTQYRPGNLTGAAKDNLKPIGTERLSKDGYPERKIREDGPAHERWRAIHLILWEEANGAIPAGHCLKCLDGDRRNSAPENWALIPRAMLPYLNGHRGLDYQSAEPEVRPAILTVAKLKHQLKETRKPNDAFPEGRS